MGQGLPLLLGPVLGGVEVGPGEQAVDDGVGGGITIGVPGALQEGT